MSYLLAGMSWADVKGKCPTKRIVPTDPNAGNIQVNIEVGESGQIFNGSATIKKGKTLLDVLQTLQKTRLSRSCLLRLHTATFLPA